MVFGNKNEFSIEIRLVDKMKPISSMNFFVHGKNILEYKYEDEMHTLQWNLDDLIHYLSMLPLYLKNDVEFPFNVKGDNAIEMDNNARDFDCENMDEFDKYYDKLGEWSYRHSWMHARSGAYIADAMFRRKDGYVEISWNNENLYDDIQFTSIKGDALIDYNVFSTVINESVEYYLTGRKL